MYVSLCERLSVLSVCVCVYMCSLNEIYCAVSVCACDVVEVHCCNIIMRPGQTEEHQNINHNDIRPNR